MNIKRKAVTFWMTLYIGFKPVLTLFISILGGITIIITFLQLGGFTLPLNIIIIVFILIFISFLITSYLYGIKSYIPDIFTSEESNFDGNYVAEISSRERLEEACRLTKPYYKEEYVPGEIAEQWHLRNNKAFVNINNKFGSLVASFGLIVPNNDFFDLFMKGSVSDTTLRGENIKSLTESKKSNRIYISGVVVLEPAKQLGKVRARVMVWAMLIYFKKIYKLSKERDLYAVAVTKESNNILKKMGFKLVSDGKERVDKCCLYHLKLNKLEWERMMKRVGDFSEMCKINF